MKQSTVAFLLTALTSAFVAVLPGRAAIITWTNSAGGGWNTAANWLPSTVPGPGDTAIIAVSDVTVSLNSSTTVGGITLGTGGAGTATLSLNGQALGLNGPLAVIQGGSFTVDSGSLTGNTNALLSGTIGWSAGTLGGILTLVSGSTLNLTTANNHDMPNCMVTNNGAVVWTNGTIRGGGNPGTFIYNNGLWDAQSDQVLAGAAFGGVGTVFNNAGTFRKSASTGGNTTFAGGTVLNNTGNLDSRTSYIVLSGGGNFTGGTATNISGFVYLNGDAFNINGTVTSTNVQLAGAALTGNNVLNGGLNWIVGVWNNSAVTIANNTMLLITTGNNHDMGNCTLTNNGTVAWADGTIRGGGNPGTFIYNNGLWDAQSDQNLAGAGLGGAGTVFNNAGTFRKSASAGGNTTFAGGTVLNNTGHLDSRTSYIVLSGGGNFTGGTATNMSGFVYLNAGAFNINGTVTSTNVQLAGAALTGNNVLNGGLNWIVGVWNNSVTMAKNTMLLITGGNNHDMGNCTVTNNGTVAWADGTIRGGGNPGTFIYNNGLWDAQSDQNLAGAGLGGAGTVFNNYGTLRKSGGTSQFATATIFASGTLFNLLAGVIDVQNGTNGLELAFQGGGNFTGGYVTTNQFGLTVLSLGNFTLNGAVTGTNTWQDVGNLVGDNFIKGALTWVGGTWNGANVTINDNTTLIVAGPGNNDLANCNMTNYGTVEWTTGNLRGGSNPGTFIYNYGLWNAQSDRSFDNGYGGAGVVFNNLGTFRKSAGASGNQTLLAGGVLYNQASGVLDVRQGNFVLQGGGNFTGGYSTTNSTGITCLSIGNFNLNGTVTGSNIVENAGSLVGTNVINGGLTWVAGPWNNATVTIASNSTVRVAGSGNNDLASCNLTNYGTVEWTSGTLRGGANPGTFIYNFGLWNAENDQTFNDAYGGSGTVFNNLGAFRKSAGSSANQTLFASGVLYNQPGGVLDVRRGNFVLQGGGNFTGGYVTANSTGITYLSIGNFNINGTLTPGLGNVVENAGALVGANIINGGLVWVAGVWNDATVTIASNSTVSVAGSGNNDLANCNLTNYGTVQWTSGTLRGGANPGTFVYNYGLWDAQSDQAFNSAYGGNGMVFNNLGTFRKELTSGTTAIQSGVTFNNSGKLDAQDGNIALQGAYSLANGTKMGFGLGGSAGNGSISLSGAASFSGSASVNFNGLFWPAGSTFNLLNYTSESGTLFTNLALPALGYISWQTNYGANAFSLSVVAHTATNMTPTSLVLSTFDSSNFLVAWPGDHTGWRLQGQTNSIQVGLTTNWFDVPGSSLTNQVVISKTNQAAFFRLAHP